MSYCVIRFYKDAHPARVIKTDLTLAQARDYCRDKESSSRTAESDEALEHTNNYGEWFDGYERD